MEKILELLEKCGAVCKDMSASHGDQRNWRIQLAEAICKQNAAEQSVQRTALPCGHAIDLLDKLDNKCLACGTKHHR